MRSEARGRTGIGRAVNYGPAIARAVEAVEVAARFEAVGCDCGERFSNRLSRPAGDAELKASVYQVGAEVDPLVGAGCVRFDQLLRSLKSTTFSSRPLGVMSARDERPVRPGVSSFAATRAVAIPTHQNLNHR
jgi:hypothetical protein